MNFRVCAQNVFFGAHGNSNHSVCIKNRSPLHPRAHRITAAELLGLPGAERFKAMGREHERDIKKLLGKKSRHGDIPRMRVHDVDLGQSLHLYEIETQRFERCLVFRIRTLSDPRPGLCATNMQLAIVKELFAPAMNLDVDLLGQFAAQVFNVNSSSAINIGRVLACHQTNSQCRSSVILSSQELDCEVEVIIRIPSSVDETSCFPEAN